MQWTRQRRAREEIAGRFCRERLLKRARRTTLTGPVKSCGPDASTPASSLAEVCRPNRARTGRLSQGDGDKKARSPGRARRKPVKPLRAGMPGDLGGPVVTTLVWLLFFHARLRVHWAPGIPHALFRAGVSCTTRAESAAGMRRCVSGITAASLRAQRSNPSFILAALWIDSLCSQ